MEVSITSSNLSEKENKLEISNNENIPKFEDIVDIKNYSIKNINEPSNDFQSNSKQKKKKLKFCCKKIGHTLCLISDKMGNPLIMIGPHWPMYFCFCGLVSLGYFSFFLSFFSYIKYFFENLWNFIIWIIFYFLYRNVFIKSWIS